jgi:hypothetical protein
MGWRKSLERGTWPYPGKGMEASRKNGEKSVLSGKKKLIIKKRRKFRRRVAFRESNVQE